MIYYDKQIKAIFDDYADFQPPLHRLPISITWGENTRGIEPGTYNLVDGEYKKL